MPNEVKYTKSFAIANAIQVRIDNNIRMLAELHARWEKEEELEKENSIVRVYTITTTSNANDLHASKPPTIDSNVIGVGNVSTTSAKRLKLPKTAETFSKSAENFQTIGDNGSTTIDNNDFDFDG